MTEAEFRRLSEAWGADLARWPQALQAEARDAAATPWGRAILAEAARTDALFASLGSDVAPARVGAGIGAVMSRLAAERRAPPFWQRIALPWAGGLATAAALGVVLAVATPLPHERAENPAGQLLELALASGDAGFLNGIGDS